MMLMGMGIRHNDTVTVTINGEDEETAFFEVQEFFRQNL
jgi:phosphotransferase system HPr-like phosphotransfer protein